MLKQRKEAATENPMNGEKNSEQKNTAPFTILNGCLTQNKLLTEQYEAAANATTTKQKMNTRPQSEYWSMFRQ